MNRKIPWQIPPPSDPVTDEYLAAVTVGERQPLDDRIRLAEYNPQWPAMFTWAADKIRSALSSQTLLLEHVGSTSVPGLAAKPIIDMLLCVADPTNEESYVPPLEGEGFELRVREPDWYEHRLLRMRSSDIGWNLHVFSAECEEVQRMLAFRDWLREHESDRRRYEEVKRALAAHTWKDTQHYADAKSAVVREILGRARKGEVADGLPRA